MNIRFPRHSIVVPTGQQFPDGALVVDGYDAAGCLLAHPEGGGFRYVIRPELAAKLRLVTDAELDESLCRYASFWLEGVDGVFEGWTDGRHWNGWAMPHFERSEAERVARAFAGCYDANRDAFI